MRYQKEFQTLGHKVRQAWRKHDFNELEFPRIAAEAAASFDLQFEFDPSGIAEFLNNTTIRQQPTNTFSNLPITVYRDDDFYIELLVWTQATTEIHEHAFSGAFKVMQGSSLHTRYAFTCEEKITLNFMIGRLETLGSEQLTRGDIREIPPGSSGLIHSLYHLDSPSVTMVIRTPGLPACQPQYAYYQPHFRINPGFFSQDHCVQMMRKLLAVTAQLEHEKSTSLWLDTIPAMDFSRLAWLLVSHHDKVEQAALLEDLKARLLKQHGKRAARLFQVMAERKRVQDLINARTVIVDPELRFFLAILMNVESRKMIFSLLEAKFPLTNPTEKCAELLARLSTGKTDAAKMLAALASQAGANASHLGRLLETAIPSDINTDPDRIRLYRQLLVSNESTDALDRLQQVFPDSSPDALQEFVNRMHRLPQIGQLFGSDSRP